MKALIKDRLVVQVELESFPVHPSLNWIDCDERVKAGWTYENGIFTAPPEPEINPDDTLKEYIGVIHYHLDNVAKQKDYKDEISISTYAVSKNQKWKAEADAFIAWRDNVWVYAYQVLDDVDAGTRQAPTHEQLIAELPVIVWPA